ncbi:MAG: GAF domain-containing protein [Actinomycetota bacterium]|nr:GAF domain-containing protein [Actinomycetota bacterium]
MAMLNAVRDILLDGSEKIMRSAKEMLPKACVDELVDRGVKTDEILLSLLKLLSCEDSEEQLRIYVKRAANSWSNVEMPWTVLADMVSVMARSTCDYLADSDEESDMESLYAHLIKVQCLMFKTCMAREKEKRNMMRGRQREIDGFPETIAATLDPSTLLKMGLEKLREFVKARNYAIFDMGSQNRLIMRYGDLDIISSSNVALSIEGEVAKSLLEKGEIYIETIPRRGSGMEELRSGYDLGSVLLAPMRTRGRTTGIILLSDGPEPRRFSPEEIETVQRFSNRIAAALENAYLHYRAQHKIKEAVALLEIARVINSTLDLQEILDRVVGMTVDLCGVVMCVVYLLDDDEGHFLPGAFNGFIEDSYWIDERANGFTVTHVGGKACSRLFAGEAVIIPADEAHFMFPPYALEEHGVDSVFLFPLTSKDRWTGIFALFYTTRAEDLEREEMETVATIAAQASMAIENAALYEDIEKSYFSTVKALAKAIEVKDPYTHGHSERVTGYALMIAEAMDLEEREKQKLKYAATLHDIGKIGIAGRVLNKAGALTEEEYTHVKTHPLLGDTIIEPVEFLQGPRPIILHHHERFDGKGYPDGLKGEDIPLSARILSVADAFEAMCSDRPYRKALPLQEAKEELLSNSGTQFDPEVVRIFLEILDLHSRNTTNIRREYGVC